MDDINRIAIIGVGLLGSSLGLAFKRFTSVTKVVGYDQNKTHLQEALEIGAIDGIINNLENNPVLAEVDLVILATPVSVIPDILNDIQQQVKSGAIITDIGSTKGWVMEEVYSQLREDIAYIPGHPMTGSEVSGPRGADAYLFENAVYVLTPIESTSGDKQKALIELLEEIGAKLLFMSPAEHDKIVAAVSHLPHVMACTLVEAVGQAATENDHVFSLAAGGFKDTTRIAAGNPKMWTDICLSNSREILEMITTFKEELAEFERILAAANQEELFARFNQTQTLRQQIPKKKRGLIASTYELVVTLPDRPKAIGEVTFLLGEAGINISDIELLQIRESGGTLRLAFADDKDLKAAEDLLTEEEYKFKVK
ncbi:prephenate dehydrogenase [Sporohalobacter salinus]|uniref:prephenate dehydrogenase n=1 Tax=Sporohalobacter salinus TaxID=1494606 RepID=UPI001960A81D|nr:prephenate dehydrogenase [Sporohalobacter salinus]MBM7623834.1 prephenate dehydrogenase [Sporohalobacter salinus]